MNAIQLGNSEHFPKFAHDFAKRNSMMMLEKTCAMSPAEEKIIEKGVQLLERGGIAHAARYFERHNIPIDVALRLLARPNKRRKSSKTD